MKAVRQAVKENKAGKFADDRQKRYMQFLSKLDWKAETSDAIDDVWEPFFDLHEKMLLGGDINELVVPALNILVSVWSAKPELCEQSGIFDSKSLLEVDIGRLLRAQQYEVYTNFIISGITQTQTHNRRRHRDFEAKVDHKLQVLMERIEKIEVWKANPGSLAQVASDNGAVNVALTSPIVIKSEEIKDGSKSALASPAEVLNSKGSSFRENAPKVAVESLCFGQNAPVELESINQSKELDLTQTKQKAPITKRYNNDQQQLDDNDKSVLKSAISKLAMSTETRPGETIEQL